MSVQQEVQPDQIQAILEAAAVRNTPAAVTCHVNQSWQGYHSRFLGVFDRQLWIEYPTPGPESRRAAPQLEIGQKIGLAFKQRHHKYVMTADVLTISEFRLSQAVATRGVQVEWPARMQRLQRRAFYRAAIPADRPSFAEFWQGGLAHEPAGMLRDKLLYSGQLIDISAGGVRLRLVGDRDPALRMGDVAGLVLRFKGLPQDIHVDAEFRHADTDEFGIMLGFQFTGLTESGEGRRTLQLIARIVSEFQRVELRRIRTGVSQYL